MFCGFVYSFLGRITILLEMFFEELLQFFNFALIFEIGTVTSSMKNICLDAIVIGIVVRLRCLNHSSIRYEKPDRYTPEKPKIEALKKSLKKKNFTQELSGQ